MLKKFDDGNDPHLSLTLSQKGWLINVMYFASTFGSLLPLFLFNKFGLKVIMTLSAILKIVAWMIIGYAHDYWMILVGRYNLIRLKNFLLLLNLSMKNVKGL